MTPEALEAMWPEIPSVVVVDKMKAATALCEIVILTR